MNSFDTYILKVSGRCNLNCSYCYMYNHIDQTWREQPKMMSKGVIDSLALRIAEHGFRYKIDLIKVSFHGGEPLLMGRTQMQYLVDALNDKLKPYGIGLEITLQTNGVLLSTEWADFFLHNNISIGLSLDGPIEVQDKRRIDHAGNGSYMQVLENIIRIKKSFPTKKIFKKVLAVIDVDSQPKEIFHHLVSLGFTDIDFLLPEGNYEIFPDGKKTVDSIEYGLWLKSAFDEWFTLNNPKIQIRTMKIILARLLGKNISLDSIGGEPVNIVTIETNGDLEPLCVFKSVQHGITKTGVNVLSHKIDDLLKSRMIKLQLQDTRHLPKACRKCKYMKVCGGGYLPHRYSSRKQFDNPSVYCRDLFSLIEHIENKAINVLGET